MHETPSQEIFDEMKEIATKIWETYDNTYGYVDEKLEKINSLENYQDNAMVMYRMFDQVNQMMMHYKLSQNSRDYINNNL